MTILFDLDNTLIDRNTAYECWLRSVFIEHGITMSPKEWQAIITADHWGYTSRNEFYDWVLSVYTLPYTTAELIQKGAEEIHRYIPVIDSKTERVLKSLQHTHEIGIVSNGGIENQMNKLKGSRLLSLFEKETIFISGAMSSSKPDQTYFEIVEERLQKSAHELVIVGDDPIHDIQGGNQAGWKTVWISKGRNDKVPADYVLNELIDIIDVL